MIIKDQHEKIQQAKEEVIRLRDDLGKGTIDTLGKTIEKLNNLLDLLFDNDNYIPGL